MLFGNDTKPKQIIHYNTDTIYDFVVGKYVRGVSGQWLLDGGISPLMTGITGREQCYKSTLSQWLMTKVILLYKDIQGMIYDSENSLLDPLARFTSFHGREAAIELLKRIPVYDKTTHAMGDMFSFIIKIAKAKKASPKDFMIETPFIDEETKKPLKMLIMSMALLDSLTYMQGKVELDKYDAKDIDDSSTNTIAMADANTKTKFVRAASNFCPNSGMSVISTAHVGDKIHMDPYAPKNKQLQYQKANDKIKSVGSGYTFLNSVLIQTTSPKVLIASGKKNQSLYPLKGMPVNELTETQIIVQRCKNNSSGDSIPFVFSQYNGFLPEVTNYNILRGKGYYGLDGNKQTHALTLLPDVNFGRTDVREKIKDYKFKRALQLTTELCFMQNYWNLSEIPFDMSITPTQLKKAIDEHPKLNIDDVLETRGYWSLDEKKETRKYMSILDLIETVDKFNKEKK